VSELKPPVKTGEHFGPNTAFAELMSELGHSATLLKQIANDNANANATSARLEAHHKPVGVFAIGDRVVMRGSHLFATGQLAGPDCARIWTVIECGCDLCERAGARLVAVDQEVDGYGWRHILKRSLRHYGQPTVDEIPADGHAERINAVSRGLRQARTTYDKASR
jgi:hypothetical protein